MIKIKLVFLVLILGFSSLNAKVWSQQDRIDLVFENMNMVQLFEQIQQKTNIFQARQLRKFINYISLIRRCAKYFYITFFLSKPI